MKECLQKKGHQVVMQLLDCISSKNTENMERALNANSILLEFCENDHCFNLLTDPTCLMKLIRICCQGEENAANLPYALKLLATIISELSNSEKEISAERKEEIQGQFAKFFTDMAYNCIMIVYQHRADENEY